MHCFRMLSFTAIAAVVGLSFVTFGSAPATAQEAAQPAQQSTSGVRNRALDRVVVTATRREETDIMTTPVAVTAISGADLAATVPQDLRDVAAFVPNFSASTITGFNAASFAMRGIGQTDIIVYLDAPVGVTVDDFVMPSIQTQLLDTFDVERVEVLRGPQGTLFGKNTTAGLVRVITKKPDLEELGGEAQFKYGNFDTIGVRAALNVPIVEGKLAVRANFLYDDSDGYYKNGAEYGPVTALDPMSSYDGLSGEGDGSDLGGKDVWGGRVKVLFEPTDNFSALLQYEILRDESDDVPSINETDPTAPFLWNFLGLTQDPGDPIDNAASTNRADSLLNMDEGHRIDVDGVYLNMELIAGDYTITSVSGYRRQDSRLPSTYTGEVGPVSLFDANRADNRDTYQQEIRIASNLDGPFNFQAGAFYQKNDARFCVVQVLGFLDLIGLEGLVPGGFNNNPQVLCNQQDGDAYALFADGTFDVTDRFSISGGIRYTWEKKKWAGRHQVLFQALEGGFDPNLTWEDFDDPLEPGDFDAYPFGVVENRESWEEPTWRITLEYDLSDELYTYATVSRGFKSGGYNDQTGTTGIPLFNDPDPNVVDATDPYDPEFATSYELGVKADVFENTLRIATTFFYVDYDDLQRGLVATIENAQGETFQETRFFNAASAEVYGLEFEMSWFPIDGLTITGNVGWQDAKYKEFQADTDFDGTIDVDFSDRPLNRAPEWTATIAATYQHVVGNAGTLSWHANFVFEDENAFIYSDIDPAFDTFLQSRELLNASITYEAMDGEYYVRIFGRNLTDDRYRTAAQPVADLWTFASYGQPRHYGIELGWKFGM